MNADEKATMQEIINTGAQTVKDLRVRCEELQSGWDDELKARNLVIDALQASECQVESLQKELSNRLHANVNAALTKQVLDLECQVSVLTTLAQAASRVVRGCESRRSTSPGYCTCDDCTALSMAIGAWVKLRDTSKGVIDGD